MSLKASQLSLPVAATILCQAGEDSQSEADGSDLESLSPAAPHLHASTDHALLFFL